LATIKKLIGAYLFQDYYQFGNLNIIFEFRKLKIAYINHMLSFNDKNKSEKSLQIIEEFFKAHFSLFSVFWPFFALLVSLE
jgi:hypothetical protein